MHKVAVRTASADTARLPLVQRPNPNTHGLQHLLERTSAKPLRTVAVWLGDEDGFLDKEEIAVELDLVDRSLGTGPEHPG